MTGRETIIGKFSTFLCWGKAQRHRWESDRKLESNMKHLVKQDPQAKEEFWARQFLKTLRELSANSKGQNISSNVIERSHLSAYLQEPCLWASHKTYDKFKFIGNRYPLEEFLQMASSAGSNPEQLLRGFQFDRPEATVKAYARVALQRTIANKIYEHDIAVKASKLSDYRLLRCISKKELKEALELQTIQEPDLTLHILAWQCFREIYQPAISNGRLEPPDEGQLQEMVKVFNQRLSAFKYAVDSINVEIFKKWVASWIKAAREYRQTCFLPINNFLENDDISLYPAPLEELEKEDLYKHLRQLIGEALQSLPDEAKTVVYLYYSLGLNQTEIGQVIDEKQYKISRHLDKSRRELLKSFFRLWNERNPKEGINEAIIDSLEKPVSEYLKEYGNIWLDKLLYRCWYEGDSQDFKNQGKRAIEAELKLISGSLDRVEAKVSTIFEQWVHTINGGR